MEFKEKTGEKIQERNHEPVLCMETLQFLFHENHSIQGKDFLYYDGTVGVGGHAAAIAKAAAEKEMKAWVVAVDRDESMLKIARQTLHHFSNCDVQFYQGSYDDLEPRVKPASVHLMLLDLGFNSLQIDDPERGFSFREGGPLDMRYDRLSGTSLLDFLHATSETDLGNIIFEFGEERQSRRIARWIKENLHSGEIKTTADLAQVVRRASGQKGYWRIDPATKTFQALRMAVNQELQLLEHFLEVFPSYLVPGGRIGIISFHSLEDRMVKNRFREMGQKDDFRLVTKKPVQGTDAEIERNPRARSAKLRVLEKNVS